MFKKILFIVMALGFGNCHGMDLFDSDASGENSPTALSPHVDYTAESVKKEIFDLIKAAAKEAPLVGYCVREKEVSVYTRAEGIIFMQTYNSYSNLASIGSYEGSKKNMSECVDRAFDAVREHKITKKSTNCSSGNPVGCFSDK